MAVRVTEGGILVPEGQPEAPLRPEPRRRRRWRVEDVDGTDGGDRRRQLYWAMGKLSERSRLTFVEWCRRNTGSPFPPDRVAPAYRGAGYGVHEAVMDVLMLHMQYGGDLELYLTHLERRAKEGR